MSKQVQFENLSEEAKEVALNEVIEKYKKNFLHERKFEELVEKDLQETLNRVHLSAKKVIFDTKTKKVLGFQQADLTTEALSTWLSLEQQTQWQTISTSEAVTLEIHINGTATPVSCHIEADFSPMESLNEEVFLKITKVTDPKLCKNRRIRAAIRNYELDPKDFAKFEQSILNSVEVIKNTIDDELKKVKSAIQERLCTILKDDTLKKDYFELCLISGKINHSFTPSGNLT